MDRVRLLTLLSGDLHEEALRQAVQICDSHLDEDPLAFWVLRSICEQLADEYENQAIPTDRYHLVSRMMQEPLMAVVKVSTESSETLVAALRHALKVFLELVERRDVP